MHLRLIQLEEPASALDRPSLEAGLSGHLYFLLRQLLIIGLAQLFVAQNLISLVDLQHQLGRFRSRILIRMQAESRFAIGAPDLLDGCVSRYPQDGVVVFYSRQGLRPNRAGNRQGWQ